MDNLNDYISGGFFISKHSDDTDYTGTKLNFYDLGSDHSQRIYFPDTWCLGWVIENDEDRLNKASMWGFDLVQSSHVLTWADAHFEKDFGWPNVIFNFETVQLIMKEFLNGQSGIEVFQIGLHKEHKDDFISELTPPQPAEGVAPEGAVGLFQAISQFSQALNEKAETLGFDSFCVEAGGVLNSKGLMNSYEEALKASELLNDSSQMRWHPWVVRKLSL